MNTNTKEPVQASHFADFPEATKDEIKVLKKILAAGLVPRSYSGRWMYGKNCIGVSIDRPGDCPAPGATFESLGHGVIAYWPDLEWREGWKTGWRGA